MQANDLLQHYPPIPVCGTTQVGDGIEMEKSVNFQHLFSLWVDLHSSQLSAKSNKAIYAELFGLSKKAIDCGLKVDMQHELLNLLKTFIYDAQNKNSQEVERADINNPAIVKHKGRPPKRLKSSVEKDSNQGRGRVLKDSTRV